MAQDNAARPNLSVLIVDSDAARLRKLKAALEEEAYPVGAAANLKAARKLLSAQSFPLALIDLQLSGEEAHKAFLEVRARDPHAVVLALAPACPIGSGALAFNQGFYDCLPSSCPAEMAVSAVDRAAERYTLTLQLIDRSHELAALQRDLAQRVKEASSEMYRVNERLNRHIGKLLEEHGAQGRFIEDMAHELKNPLSVIWGYSSFVLRRPIEEWTPSDLSRALTSIHRNAEHLHELIEELLDSTRLAGNKISLRCETFLAFDAVKEVAEGLKVQAQEKGLSLLSEVPDHLVTVYADRNRLRQVLVNLVNNALKFTPKGGSVTISAKPADGVVHFCVSDTGRGIAKPDLERVFERFYQVPETRNLHKGLGLGLSIVRGLIELHGGRIWAESEPGKGARFHFTLPATLTVAAAEEEAEEDAASTSPS
ncbi:MAG: response regulator [Elusimicrobia bacterium]|nr:response regulator [Elusimicrobiota bacterium]